MIRRASLDRWLWPSASSSCSAIFVTIACEELGHSPVNSTIDPTPLIAAPAAPTAILPAAAAPMIATRQLAV